MTDATWMLIAQFAAVVLWFVFAAAVGSYGKSKGYSFIRGFVISVLTSPLVGYIVMSMLPERDTEGTLPAQLALTIELEKAKARARLLREQRAAGPLSNT